MSLSLIQELKELSDSFIGFSDTIKTKLLGKLGKTEQAADSAKLGGKTFNELGASSQGLVGQLPFIGKDNVSVSFAPAELLTKFRMGTNDAQIATLKTNVQSMADVFSKWDRISHGTAGVFPALPAELDSWAYDAPLDTVKMLINSVSMLGIVSPYTFDEYTFDVVVSSNNPDDDSLGLILAFVNIDGVEHTLTAQVSTGGMDWSTIGGTPQPKMNIVANLGQTPARGTKLIFTKDLGPVRQGWNGADFIGGIRIRAVRSANGTMSVQAMKPDGTNFSGGECKWTGTIPDPFKGKCAIGYFAISQPAGIYINNTVPQPKTDIVDTRNLDVHRWNNTNSQWAIAGKAGTILPVGRLYKNTEGTRGTYYLDLDGQLVEVNVGETTLSVNEYVTLAAGVVKEYDLQAILGAFVANYDIKTAEIVVRVKDANSASPMYNVYANAEGIVSYGIRDERYVVVANQSAASQAVYVKVTVKHK